MLQPRWIVLSNAVEFWQVFRSPTRTARVSCEFDAFSIGKVDYNTCCALLQATCGAFGSRTSARVSAAASPERIEALNLGSYHSQEYEGNLLDAAPWIRDMT